MTSGDVDPIRLSYVTATKNKLSYLKVALEKLISHKKSDEEIIVADGASTDGTPEYLAELKRAGAIDDFISEPDFAESHALNKLFLRARGDIIKIINDDDAYYYPTINACKEFMISHPEIDVLGVGGGSFKHQTPERQVLLPVSGYVENFKKWKANGTPFEFSVLGLMFRRSSLPILGLWDLSFKNADAEYTFRITAGRAKVAWCLSPGFVFIRVPEGVTMKNLQRMRAETLRLRKFYLNEDPPSKILIALKRPIRNMRELLQARANQTSTRQSESWGDLYSEAEQWLIEQNRGRTPEFLF